MKGKYDRFGNLNYTFTAESKHGLEFNITARNADLSSIDHEGYVERINNLIEKGRTLIVTIRGAFLISDDGDEVIAVTKPIEGIEIVYYDGRQCYRIPQKELS